MEEKLRFVFEYDAHEQSMTELCQRYEIARETGYVWLRRYRHAGVAGLVEHSRAAQRHDNYTSEDIEQMVLELRQAHMRWGPRKLKWVLQRDEPGRRWPAASTIGALLKRAGLVVARKKRFCTAPYTEPLAHADEANRVRYTDFKGWFRTTDGQRIDPLTISDARSRYLLRCQAVEKTDTARVQAIRTDNGVGDRARAHRGRTSGAKRKTRTDASHSETGDGPAARSQPARAAADAGPLSPGIQ
jgi:putative transposase